MPELSPLHPTNDTQLSSSVSRRQLLVAGGTASAALLLATRLGTGTAHAANACATITPAGEIGPYFVDEKLNRSDVTTDPDTGVAVAGVPVTLNWTLLNEDDSCKPLVGTQVDIWEADPSGLYSDEAAENTVGKKYLRGYQVSDSGGKVTFKTVFPGWYSGRTPHIHARFRIFDASGTATYDFLTQVMFNESDITAIYAVAPYSARASQRDTTNANDHVYQSESSEGTPVLLAMTGNTTDGYVGTFTFGLVPSGGVAAGGGTGTGIGAGGTPPPGGPGGTPPTGTTPTATTPAATTPATATTTSGSSNTNTSSSSSTADATVLATCSSATVSKSLTGKRTITLKVNTKETTSATIKFRRGSKTLKTSTFSNISSGTRTLKIGVPGSITAGRVTIDMTFKDKAGNTKQISKIRTLPSTK